MKIAKVGIVGLGVISALTVSVPGFAGGNKYASVSESQVCDGPANNQHDTVNFFGPETLWPPNHKFVAESITAQGDSTSEAVSLDVTPVVTDAIGGDGGPQHDPDYTPYNEDGSPIMASGTGAATVNFSLRSERSGKGDGRTYTINWSASFDNGANTCSSGDSEGHTPFVVTVPHDMRNKNN